ncbi:efflux RND transporter periplasmic adaptor subunit [Mesorhizobium sp. RMAD-H1]|uniref:efflux RND transporter periplasmic adaptor subunit n=1 Tax=Mesorhizobium sp. RMAD-H1 TaxID=2587065 RepID=UPI0017D4B571|nr:efflux RND transporter periplasmic adaptor subunit [Mesorhizobium sp. RMAD-H1]MBB2972641.1 RND family efflux transporter MFP subunit [Mesorhizobium sp. RMAD-H1]
MSINAWLKPLCPPWRAVRCGIIAALLAALVPVAQARQQMPVTVTVAKRGDITQRISVVGTLAAREEVQVHPSATGREIQHILLEIGQRVQQGQPLALFDKTDALLALDKNTVSALRARAAVAVEAGKVDVALVAEREARRKLERSQALQAKGIVSEQVLDDNRNAYDRAVAETALARQSLALAQAEEQLITQERKEIELTIERSTLRAPAPGLILERNARLGVMTSSSGDPLFRIAKDGKIEFVAEVMETNFVRLREGMRAQIAVPGRDEPVAGTLRLNAAQLDPKTRSGTVRVALDEGEGLIPGVFARGVIDMSTRTNVLLPATAVRSMRGSHSVYVVRDDVVEARSVRIGARQDDLVEILAGVEDGEMIVLKAGGFLKDQDRVEPVVISAEGDPQREVSQTVSFDRSEGTAH